MTQLSIIAGLGNPEDKYERTLHNAGFWFVDAVAREGEGYRVEGRMRDGRDFACGVDGDGCIRKVAIDGQAMI